jgi:hypothetical protein
MRFVQNVDLHVRVYTLPSEVRERYEVSVDVVAFRGRQLVAWPDCPFCGVEIDKIDDFEFVRGEPLDLRTYDTPYKETLSLELSEESSVEAGVNIPGLPGIVEGGKTGLSVRREANISCNVMYEFANGRVYQPYWERSDSQSLQYWGVE